MVLQLITSRRDAPSDPASSSTGGGAESKRSIAVIERELEARKCEEADTVASGIGSLCAAGCGEIAALSDKAAADKAGKKARRKLARLKLAADKAAADKAAADKAAATYVITATDVNSISKVSRIIFTRERARVKFYVTSHDRNLQRQATTLEGYNSAEGASDLDFLGHIALFCFGTVLVGSPSLWRLLRGSTELVAARPNPDDIDRFLRNDWGLPQAF